MSGRAMSLDASLTRNDDDLFSLVRRGLERAQELREELVGDGECGVRVEALCPLRQPRSHYGFVRLEADQSPSTAGTLDESLALLASHALPQARVDDDVTAPCVTRLVRRSSRDRRATAL